MLDLVGASGPLDFDDTTGDALSDIAMWCVHTDNGLSFDPQLSDYYSATTRELELSASPPRDFTDPGWCDADPGPPDSN